MSTWVPRGVIMVPAINKANCRGCVFKGNNTGCPQRGDYEYLCCGGQRAVVEYHTSIWIKDTEEAMAVYVAERLTA